MRFTKKIGVILLAIFLIIFGLSLAAKLTFEGIGLIEGVLAIAAGILLLIDR